MSNPADLAMRKAYQSVFCSTNDGVVVLTDILNECGYMANEKADVDPSRIALANSILWKAGIWAYGPASGPKQLFDQVEALTRNATINDLNEEVDT